MGNKSTSFTCANCGKKKVSRSAWRPRMITGWFHVLEVRRKNGLLDNELRTFCSSDCLVSFHSSTTTPKYYGDVSDEDVEKIEKSIGCGHYAWDTEDPREIIAECWNQLIRKSNENSGPS